MSQFNFANIDADLRALGRGLPDLVKEAANSRAKSLETAIRGYYDSGVSLDRMAIHESRDATESVLHVDGVPRFTWRLVYTS